MPKHTIEYIDIETLVPAEHNAKAHDQGLLGESFDRFGFIESIVMDDRTDRMIAGHGRHERLLAAKAAGEPLPDGVIVKGGKWLAPVERGWASKDDAEAIAAGIAINKIGERGGWNVVLLLPDLLELQALGDDGLHALGYDDDDLADLKVMVGTMEALEKQSQKIGEPGERDFWPVLRYVIAPDTKTAWDAAMSTLASAMPETDDAAKIARLVELATLAMEE